MLRFHTAAAGVVLVLMYLLISAGISHVFRSIKPALGQRFDVFFLNLWKAEKGFDSFATSSALIGLVIRWLTDR